VACSRRPGGRARDGRAPRAAGACARSDPGDRRSRGRVERGGRRGDRADRVDGGALAERRRVDRPCPRAGRGARHAPAEGRAASDRPGIAAGRARRLGVRPQGAHAGLLRASRGARARCGRRSGDERACARLAHGGERRAGSACDGRERRRLVRRCALRPPPLRLGGKLRPLAARGRPRPRVAPTDPEAPRPRQEHPHATDQGYP
jgi:hypothetical protein